MQLIIDSFICRIEPEPPHPPPKKEKQKLFRPVILMHHYIHLRIEDMTQNIIVELAWQSFFVTWGIYYLRI